MDRSLTPQPEDSARNFSIDPAQNAAALLRQFHDIQSLVEPNDVIAYYHSAHAAWRQCDKKRHEIEMRGFSNAATHRQERTQEALLERQADLLAQTRRSCASRMAALALEKIGAERRNLCARFKASLKSAWPQFDDSDVFGHVPLWFYKGAFK